MKEMMPNTTNASIGLQAYGYRRRLCKNFTQCLENNIRECFPTIGSLTKIEYVLSSCHERRCPENASGLQKRGKAIQG
jgi:hypothetical protein